MSSTQVRGESATEIRPFHIEIPQDESDESNHFAAWHKPEIFTTEVRAAFRALRANGSS
jgi:hypothetical protein